METEGVNPGDFFLSVWLVGWLCLTSSYHLRGQGHRKRYLLMISRRGGKS